MSSQNETGAVRQAHVASDGAAVKVSQSLVFNKGRLYSMTRNSPVIVEAPERLGTDLLGWASLMVEEGLPHGLGPDRRTS